MRLGINMPVVDSEGKPLTAAGVMERARAIEAAGFDSAWLSDIPPRIEITSPRPDNFQWLLVAAAATQHMEVGTAILQVPLRNPIHLAHQLMTLETLLRGRFIAGLGSGSNLRSFEFYGLGDQFENRFKLFAEDLSIMKKLFNGEQIGESLLQPSEEVKGGPPVVIGAWASGIWVRRAARDWDGWMASAGRTNMKTLGEAIQRFRDFGGKRAMVATIVTDLSQPESALDEEAAELRGDINVINAVGAPAGQHGVSLACGPKSASERLHRLAELGFDDALLTVRNPKYPQGYVSDEDFAAIRALIEKDSRRAAIV